MLFFDKLPIFEGHDYSTSNNTKMVQHTWWLKLKYPAGQNAISRQPCEISIPKFLDLYGRDPATILNLKKIILVFTKVTAI